MTGCFHPSSLNHLEGGWFPRSGASNVEIANRSTFEGNLFAKSHSVSASTSRWQCGHQWAKNATTRGRPSGAIRTNSFVSRSTPVAIGASFPTAESFSVVSKGAKALPSTEDSVITSSACETGSCFESPRQAPAINIGPINVGNSQRITTLTLTQERSQN